MNISLFPANCCQQSGPSIIISSLLDFHIRQDLSFIPAMQMAIRNVLLLLALVSLCNGLEIADRWNILNPERRAPLLGGTSLKNYCESWRMNVELNNIRGFEVVPQECISYIGKYMTSTQYKTDSQRAIEQCHLHLTSCCTLRGDGKDAWIFDVDDTLLSTVPYFKIHGFG